MSTLRLEHLIYILPLLAWGCRHIDPPPPKYDVEPEPAVEVARADTDSTEQPAEQQPEPAEAAEKLAPPVIAPRTLCEESTVEMPGWEIADLGEEGTTLCRADEPVEDVEVGYRWRQRRVELDILLNPKPVGATLDELNISLTNASDGPLEIRVSCFSPAAEARNEVCKKYSGGQMVNFDIECTAKTVIGGGNSFEIEVLVSHTPGQADRHAFTIGPDNDEC